MPEFIWAFLKSDMELKLTYIGLKMSYVGLKLSYMGLYQTYVTYM